MGLTEELHGAVESPPPPGYDLDVLIDLGRRRRTRSRAVAGIAGPAFVVLALVGGYSVYHTWLATDAAPSTTTQVGAPPGPPATAGGAATPAEVDETRFTAAMVDLPGGLHIPPGTRFTRHNDYYNANWQYNGINFYINIREDSVQPGDGCARGQDGGGCVGVPDADGTTFTTLTPAGDTEHPVDTVLYFRNDGTSIEVTAIGSGALPTGTQTDLTTAAHDPALSLHP